MSPFSPVRRGSLAGILSVLIAGPAFAQAGVTIQQKTSFNVARITSADLEQTVSILGADRSRTVTTGKMKVLILSRDASGTEIVRLDRGEIIKLDDKKKRYEIKSLDEVRAELAKQQKDAAKAAENQEKEGTRYYAVVDEARRTGQHQQINGFNTEQVLIRITVMAEDAKTKKSAPYLHLISDSWVDPSQKEAARISQAFNQARLQALGMDPAMAANPYAKWLTDVNTEMAKLEGYPIRTQVTFELAVDSATAAAQAQEQSEPSPSPNPLGRGLGGLLGRGKAKADTAKPSGSGRPVLFTATTEVLAISRTPPAAADFEIPTGYEKK